MIIREMNYHVEMRGSGSPLLLLHGFTGSSQNWASQLEFFSQQFLTIAPDLPGHGKTESPADLSRYSIEHTAEDIVTLLKNLTQEPVHLVGYSMGGRLALYLALKYPQVFRSGILESASPGLESPEARLERRLSDEQLALRIEQNGIPDFVDYWERLPLFDSQKNLPEQVRQNLKNQRLNNHPGGLANSLRGMGTGVQPSLWEKLQQLHLPTLLLTGELDSKFTQIARQMQARLPHAQHTIIPSAGHTIHLEQPELFNRTVLEFLPPAGLKNGV